MSTQTDAPPVTLHFVCLANAAKALNVTTPELTSVLRELTPVERSVLADDILKQEG